eukprot:gb/GECH01000479.1/.p1 GENE.gb/GECH01000479.1/~~gb/GECH01000479.1/.p1  ORF type:complete len:321 (+),score=89.70 gb/GECH01000479.1/:1-963(+)
MKARVKSIIPPLSPQFHKGQAGRIGVVGGCFEYTGAPYYASVSSLHTGGDLSFILCSKTAATPIKSYSPEVIVYPVLPDEDGEHHGHDDTTTTTSNEKNMENMIAQVNTVTSSLFKRIHTLVIGPGLGRGDKMMHCTTHIIQQAKEHNLPIILDGDALFLLTKDPSIIQDYRRAILTPNHVEFKRLCNAVNIQEKDDENINEKAKQLAQSLGGTTLLVKGPNDIITDGDQLEVVTEPGSHRRCGGQGDVLAGTAGTFLHWGVTHHLREKDHTDILAAAYGAALVTRTASLMATAKGKRFTTTPDIIKELGEAFQHHFPDD